MLLQLLEWWDRTSPAHCRPQDLPMDPKTAGPTRSPKLPPPTHHGWVWTSWWKIWKRVDVGPWHQQWTFNQEELYEGHKKVQWMDAAMFSFLEKTTASAKPVKSEGKAKLFANASWFKSVLFVLDFEVSSIVFASSWTSLELSWYLLLWRFSMNGVRSSWTHHNNAIMLKQWKHFPIRSLLEHLS